MNRLIPVGQIHQLRTAIVNKRTRNFVFLIFTIVIIFALNALLPTIEGNTHYTADPRSMTYEEYKLLKEDNEHYTLTWSSEEEVNNHIKEYKELNGIPDYTVIEPPAEFTVNVYTKFFFQHIFWYITTFTHVVSAVLLFYSIFNYLIDRYKDEYERYITLEAELNKLASNSLDPGTFEPWMVNVFNRNRKHNQHINNVKYKLSVLESRTPYNVRLEVGVSESRKCKKYLEKRSTLLEQLEPEYINTMVEHKKVKYFKFIHPTYVTCGVNHIGRTVDNYSNLESNSARLGKDTIVKVFTSLLLTVMFASLLTMTVVTAADKPWYWICIDILATISPLIIQVPLAYDYCAQYMDEQLIPNLMSRKTIALLYLAYMKGEHNES
jgi:hypothetical protein